MAKRPAETWITADVIRLLLAIVGVLILSYGAWLHYHPLGFITAGFCLLGVATIGGLRAK